MTPAARLQAAIDLLDGFAASAFPADRFIREFFRARRYAGSKDRAAVTERVYDVFRHRAAYAWRMRGDTNRALVIGSLIAESLDEAAIAALFTGDGYGPAALRNDERTAIAHPPAGEMPLAARGSFPEFLLPELERRFGGDLLPEMLALTGRASVDLRVNTLKAIRTDVLRELGEAGFDAEPTPFASHGIRIGGGKSTASLQQSKLFLSGAFEFQDEAAQIAAALCAVEPGMRVLDLAAGAGGKSLALAATMRNWGEIVACDIRRGALDQLEVRAIRAGASIIKTRLPEALAADEQFDVVLVDAPCSGTGTWRRQPELRWRLTPHRLDELTALQNQLLHQAARHVKPDGRLVYATCSILPRENQIALQAFLAMNARFHVRRTDANDYGLVNRPPGLETYFVASPATTGTDGFFTAVLTRATPVDRSYPPAPRNYEPPAKIEVLEGLEPVRRRPGMYIGGTDAGALTSMAEEILKFATSDADGEPATLIALQLGAGDIVTIEDNGPGIPNDPHPRLKKMSGLEATMTTLVIGRFPGRAIVNALSDWMHVTVARDGRLHTMRFERGKTVEGLTEGEFVDYHGTRYSFHPDPVIFGNDTHVQPVTLYRMAKSMVEQQSGLQIRWTCDPSLIVDDTPAEETLMNKGDTQ